MIIQWSKYFILSNVQFKAVNENAGVVYETRLIIVGPFPLYFWQTGRNKAE